MKINRSYILCPLLVLGMGAAYLTYRHKTTSLMQGFIAQSLLNDNIAYKTLTTNLSANALVFYQITHAGYPALKARRLQISNQNDTLQISIKGLSGNLAQYFYQTDGVGFKERIEKYHATSDLLAQPLLSLAVLTPHLEGDNILFSAQRTAPNQIVAQLFYQTNGQTMAHFSAKFSPHKPQGSVLENIKENPLRFQLVYLNPEWKKRLDDYALSKNQPFLTENTPYLFSF